MKMTSEWQLIESAITVLILLHRMFFMWPGGKMKKQLISPHPLSLHSPEERWSRGVYERENKNETAMAGGETICLHS